MKLFLIITAGIVVIAWLLLSQPGDKPVSAAVAPAAAVDRIASLEQRVASLTQTLDQELLLRQQLERRLQHLEQSAPGALERTAIDAQQADRSKGSDRNPDSGEADDEADIGQRLINVGLAPQTVQQIREVIDEARLQRLQIRDQAIREGWRDSPEFTEKMHQLGDPAEQVRERFGDAAYDRYLYASERPNRVAVREVMRGSAAELAGVQAGDIIERYASTPIYSMSALRQATTEGVAGESVLLELKRKQQPVTTVLPRGPLGITMEFIQVAPQ